MSRQRALSQAADLLDSAGLAASVHVRDLDTLEEVSLAADDLFPMASVVKVPLALVIAEHITNGDFDPALPMTLPADPRVQNRAASGVVFDRASARGAGPDSLSGTLEACPATPGPAGTSAFGHTATVALEDLLHLAVSVSDNRAADALFTLAAPARVHEQLLAKGINGFHIHTDLRHLTTPHPSSRSGVGLHGEGGTSPSRTSRGQASPSPPPTRELAAGQDATNMAAAMISSRDSTEGGLRPAAKGATSAQGEAAWLLQDNTATARSAADLLGELWRPQRSDLRAAARVRTLMSASVYRQRLAPDLATRQATWATKTATVGRFRHEIGVVDRANGSAVAVCVFSRAVREVAEQAADAALGAVARLLYEALTDGGS